MLQLQIMHRSDRMKFLIYVGLFIVGALFLAKLGGLVFLAVVDRAGSRPGYFVITQAVYVVSLGVVFVALWKARSPSKPEADQAETG